MDDWQLLQSYVERDSETAFRTLLNRYAGLVYSVAIRKVRDAQLAEEVAQAVFILLAQKARGFRQSVVLPGWLFRTTRFVASRTVRAEQRRQRREQETLAMQQLTSPDDAWKRISPALDEALENLSEADRNAVLLRYFNDKSHRETAAALGISEDAAKKRVTRALEKLRSFFTRRGITLSVGLLGSAVAANAAKAATPEIIERITAKVIAQGSMAAGILPPLAAQTLNIWRWMKIKLAGVGVGLGIVALVLVTSTMRQGSESAPSDSLAAAPKAAPSISAGEQMTVRSEQPALLARNFGRMRPLRFHVVAADNGDAVPFAKLAINTAVDRTWDVRFDLMTDETGVCEVPLPAGLVRLDVGVMASGWEARFATWRIDKDKKFPPEYTLRVQRVTQMIGGWLRDEAGKPVVGAEIRMRFGGGGDSSSREPPRERMGIFDDAPVATSDRDGRWTCALIPADNQRYYSLRALHSNFAPTPIESGSPQRSDEDLKRESFRQLWAGTLSTTMNRGLALMGRISDEAGQPIPQAQIHHQPHATSARLFTADDEGRFIVPNLASGRFPITVTAPGFAPEYREVDVRSDMEPLSFRLKPGALLRLQIVDEQGLEVPDAHVVLEQWADYRHVLKWESTSGPDGRVEWNSAPPDRLQICALKNGWCYTRDVWMKPDGEEHKITLQRALVLAGHVTDAETGVAIPEFKAFPGYGEGRDELVWDRGNTRHGENGDFTVTFDETRRPWRVRVEADGYISATSPSLTSDVGQILELRLTPSTATNGIHGIVRLPDGQPATAAEVALCTFEHFIAARLVDARFVEPGASIKRTDAEGRYSFPQNQEAHTVIATHAAGFARIRLKPGTSPTDIALQPWGRIEGTVQAGAITNGQWKAVLSDWASAQYNGGLVLDDKFFSTPLNAIGQFAFEKVPPGNFYVSLESGLNSGRVLYTPVSIPPGQTAQVQVGGLGRHVAGRLAAGEVEGVTNWTTQVLSAGLHPDVRHPRPSSPDSSPNGMKNWEVDFWQSEAGHKALFANRSFALSITPDGAFTAYDVVPGTYNLLMHVTKLPRSTSTVIGDLSEKVVIPKASDADQPAVDLGTLVLRKSKN